MDNIRNSLIIKGKGEQSYNNNNRLLITGKQSNNIGKSLIKTATVDKIGKSLIISGVV